MDGIRPDSGGALVIALFGATVRAHFTGAAAIALNLVLPVVLSTALILLHGETSLRAPDQPVEQTTYRASMESSPVATTRAGVICALAMAAVVAARGLHDDASGLRARVRSLGTSTRSLAIARFGAMAVVAWLQLALAFAWSVLVFDVRIESVPALAVSTAILAVACAAFIAIVAALCGIFLRKRSLA